MVVVNQAPFAVILLMSTLHVKIVNSMRDEQRSLSRSSSLERYAAQMRESIRYQLSVRDNRRIVRATVEKDPCVDNYYPWGAQKEAARQGCKDAVAAFKSLPPKDKEGCDNPGDASCQLVNNSNVCTVKCDLPIDQQEPGCCFCPPLSQTPIPLADLVPYFGDDPPSLDQSAEEWGVFRSSSFLNGGSGSPPRSTGSPPRGTGSPPRGTGSPPRGTSSPPRGTGSPPRGTGSPPRGTGSPPRRNRRRSPTRQQPDRIPTTGEDNIDAQATEYIKMHPHPQTNGAPRWSPPKDRPRPERRVTSGDSNIDSQAGDFIDHFHHEHDSNGVTVDVDFRHSDDRQYARSETNVDKRATGYIDKVRNKFAKQKTGSMLRRSSTNLFKGLGKALSLPKLLGSKSKRAKADHGSSYGG